MQGWLVGSTMHGLFNWSMTFKSDSDFVLAYGVILPGRDDANVFNPNKDYLAGRDKMAVAVISNCYKSRMNCIRELKKYIFLSKYLVDVASHAEIVLIIFQSISLFLSFENCLCKDYVTEKFYHNGLTHQLVPEAMNKVNLSNVHVAPPESYINALEFRNAKELAHYMMGVSNRWTGFSTGTWDWIIYWNVGLDCWTGILSTETRLPCMPETDN